MRTIAIINQKGGCGKTTTSINLAACMARLGHRTLLVDMDPQGHCGVGLAVPEEQIERTIYDTLIDPSDGKVARLAEIVWQIASDFDLAPANLRLAAFEQVFAGRPGREDRLARALDSVRDTYQWCVIDCPPSVGLLTFNALRASDEVIVPVETGYFSLHGLTKMMETLEELKEQYNNDVLIRVLPTLYDTRTKLAREVLSELRAKFRDYLMESTVNFNTKLKEAASFGQPITEYDPGSRGYKDFVNLARELMGHRPVEVEPAVSEKMSRPAELVQRAKQLAQLTNSQFGRGTITFGANGAGAFGSGSGTMAPAGLTPVGMGNGGGGASPFMSPATPFSRVGTSSIPASASPVALTPAPSAPPAPSRFADEADAAPVHTDSFGRMAEPLARAAESLSRAAEPMNRVAEPVNRAEPVSRVAEQPRTTQQKIDDFYGVKQQGEEVIFAARFDLAQQVMIAGDFNGWSPVATPLHSQNGHGAWTTRLPLRPGRYRYRFIVDGKWMTDPHNTYVESNQFGELNNIVEVA